MLDISVLGDFERRYLELADLKDLDALTSLDSTCLQYLQQHPIVVEEFSQPELVALQKALEELQSTQQQLLARCQSQAEQLEKDLVKIGHGHRSAASYLGIANQ